MNPHRLGLRTLIACIAVTGVVIMTVKVLRERQPFPRLIAAAQRAPTRPIEGRLAGFPYRPKVLTIKSNSSRAEPRLRGVAASVLESGDANSNSIHDRGIAQLLRNDAHGAVQSLQRAVLEAPRDATAWSDLSAAFIDQARLEDSPQQCASALAAANHAIAIDPSAPAAQFNRAIALDHLGILPAAIRAYDDYLLTEPSGGWANEARMRTVSLQRLSTTDRWESVRPEVERRCTAGTGDIADIVRRFPQESR